MYLSLFLLRKISMRLTHAMQSIFFEVFFPTLWIVYFLPTEIYRGRGSGNSFLVDLLLKCQSVRYEYMFNILLLFITWRIKFWTIFLYFYFYSRYLQILRYSSIHWYFNKWKVIKSYFMKNVRTLKKIVYCQNSIKIAKIAWNLVKIAKNTIEIA